MPFLIFYASAKSHRTLQQRSTDISANSCLIGMTDGMVFKSFQRYLGPDPVSCRAPSTSTGINRSEGTCHFSGLGPTWEEMVRRNTAARCSSWTHNKLLRVNTYKIRCVWARMSRIQSTLIFWRGNRFRSYGTKPSVLGELPTKSTLLWQAVVRQPPLPQFPCFRLPRNSPKHHSNYLLGYDPL